ncbi:MAG: tryptophan 7-halogenase [Fimbriimonadaceae bacterium]|nr:tryptophan 7-halogenase [Fimbriimonadaceae bacterium]
MRCDVAIIGGGPGGSTLGSFLRRYGQGLDVRIFERDKFPRDHVGESQLPLTSHFLAEMGCWHKVEAADFPVKVGATYKWGVTNELWDFDFIPPARLADMQRPGDFEGPRQFTAFQVDRAVYDKILLDHAAELGCTVYEETKVTKVAREGDRVTHLTLDSGETVEAKHYIDASGHVGVLRRALDVPVEVPTSLQNIAVWDYWQNADWAESIGVGGTRIQIMSVGFGWLWFIPLGPTRTSVGLVMPAEYYKKSGKRPEELYTEALAMEDRIAALMRDAVSEGKFTTTKDWSFLARRLYGENWFLVGESAGFADPILSAGLTITHAAGREAAFTILELERGQEDPTWLKNEYERLQFNRVRNHIRFADYWYSANAQFKDLQDFTKEVAEMNGLDLAPDKAWAWLAQGGFIDDDLTAGRATYSVSAIKGLGQHLSPLDVTDPLSTNNVFTLALDESEIIERARYVEGEVRRYQAYFRNGRMFPLEGPYILIHDVLQKYQKLPEIGAEIRRVASLNPDNQHFQKFILGQVTVALEALIHSGWVVPSYDPSLPLFPRDTEFKNMHWHIDLDNPVRMSKEVAKST